jgi:hypothetical protein
MHSNLPRKTSTAFEYFLYAAILAETALAALIYKVLFRNPELTHLRVYFAIFYFAFLGWCIVQLNRLHRDRKSAVAAPPPVAEPATEEVVSNDTRPLFGLTGPQLAIIVVVFASAIAAFSWVLRLLD